MGNQTSLYGKYIKEREGFDICETKSGFATFQKLGDTIYIRDIYVEPDLRAMGYASDLADMICENAVKEGCKTLVGTVDVNSKGATASLKVLLAYGMHLKSVNGNLIIFEKGI